MTISKFGYQVHTHGLSAEADTYLNNSISTLGSTVSLVLNNSTYAHALKHNHPDTEITLRLMPSNGGSDDELHKDKNGRKAVSPLEHIEWYEAHISDKRILCHGMNEAQLDADGQLDKEALQWSIDFGKGCVERGLRAVLWNTGAGKVNDKNVHALQPLIELINANPGKLYLGLHEYSGIDYRAMSPWLFGSFLFIHKFCDDNGLSRPEIIFTEWGFDTIHQHPAGGTWNLREAIHYAGGANKAAQVLINAYNDLYAGYDNLIGFCFFSYGSETDKWNDYDITRTSGWPPAFMDHIVANWPREEDAPMAEPDGRKVILTTIPGGALNFRASPAIGTNILHVLRDGDAVWLTGQSESDANYDWYQAALLDGRVGWFAAIPGLVASEPLGTPPGDDTPEPEAPPAGLCALLRWLIKWFGCEC